MKKLLSNKIIVLVIFTSLVLGACAFPGPFDAGIKETFTPPIHDEAFAKEICGDRPIDSFDPTSGFVECAKVDVTSEPEEEEESALVEDGEEEEESETLLVQETACRVIHDSVIPDEMNHVSTSGAWLHVEYFIPGQPERETILDASEAAGGRYNFDESHGQIIGWVWEYADCTFEEVQDQVEAHIPRRRAGGADNDGFYAFDFEHEDVGKAWHPTNLFLPVEAGE